MTGARIVVALDPAAPAGGALDAVARLARELGAVVEGVFIEDDDVHRLAALGLACEIPADRSATRTLSEASLSAQLGQSAAEMLAELQGGFHPMPVNLLRLRGDVPGTLIRHAEGAVLLVVGRNARAAGRHTWFGAAVTAVANRPPASLLFVNEPWASGSRVLLLGDPEPSAAARRAAERLAAADRLPLGELRLPVPLDAEALLARCADEDARVLALSVEQAAKHSLALADLVEAAPVSLLLVR